eukprot:CAMPEP_0113521856 /NCGR_PEP_ID=MMETSP0014_2-20120614/44875_1 /TAXON_ID=2857 /ORGANISM="Nitzschia sp." /LENGTH=221 /DNA_ID=CAMNT_0000419867 /DNA_START=163 /DNA_END=825 /DNA_ORIENTATION=+ /assembly_acc=CAM_ASM_000159
MIPTRSRQSPGKNASRTAAKSTASSVYSYPSVIPIYSSSLFSNTTTATTTTTISSGSSCNISNRVSRNWRWVPLVVIATATMLYIVVNTNGSQSSITLLDTLNNSTTTTIHDNKYGNHDMNLKLIKKKNIGYKHDYDKTTTTTGTNFNGFSFFLMGDTPYRDWQVSRLKVQMNEMKDIVRREKDQENNKDILVDRHNISFTVHVGDIQKIDLTQCNESAYE